jgi:hypothetical protein
MERTVDSRLGFALPEHLSFAIKAVILLSVSGALLYLVLAATYPPIHDTFHQFRHSLAVVPCH